MELNIPGFRNGTCHHIGDEMREKPFILTKAELGELFQRDGVCSALVEFDGIRAIIINDKVFSRDGRPVYLPDEFELLWYDLFRAEDMSLYLYVKEKYRYLERIDNG